MLCTMAMSHWIVFSSVRNANIFNMLVVAAGYVAALTLAGFYRVRIDNSSIGLLRRALVAMIPLTALYLLIAGFTEGFTSTEFRYILASGCISIGVICGARALIRLLTEEKEDTSKPSAVVYGAGELGTTMARMCQRGKFDYHIVGYIDDDPELKDQIIVDYPVLGNLDNLEKALVDTKAEVLLIAITNIKAEKIQKALAAAKKNNVQSKIVPNLFEVQSNHSEPVFRDIKIEDLLGRQLNTIDKEPLFEMFGNKTILVTGAGGSIGSEICKQLMEFGLERLILLDIDETELHDQALRMLNYEKEWSDKVVPVVCDIKNGAKLQKIFEQYKPDIVFHAAAYKHVPLMELYPEEAILTNICGSYNVFKAASDNGVKRVVVISTDKAVNPTNIMGATKRVVEMMSASFDKETKTDFCCVRFGNVIGSRGSMLPLFLEQIKDGVPITVTDRKIIRYFMAIPEAVSLVFKAATLAKGGEVMVLDMGEPVNIYDFAQRLITLYGDERSSIKVTGLRPGEKLYEELLASKDNTIPTTDKKVFKAKVSRKTSFTLEHLAQIVENMPSLTTDELIQHLCHTVPEFNRKK